MKSSTVALHLCGFVSTLAVFWSFLWVVPLIGLAHTAINGRGYHRATFVVERLIYHHGNDQAEGIDLTRFWAEGKVDGRTEKFSLNDSLQKPPTSQQQLEALVRPGQTFAVIYNPDVSEVAVQGQYLRVLKDQPDSGQSVSGRLVRWALVAYGPLVFAVALAVPFWRVADRRHRRLSLGWLALDAAGLAVEGCAVLLFLALPTLERLMGRGSP
jgi:hypothetical protein